MRGGTILVIGAYGFIGSAIARMLARVGHPVRGLGRSAARGRRMLPGIDWVEGDLRAMTTPEDWTAALDGASAVVNAAGALQDGARDCLRAVHDRAIRALVAACTAPLFRPHTTWSTGFDGSSKKWPACRQALLCACPMNW